MSPTFSNSSELTIVPFGQVITAYQDSESSIRFYVKNLRQQGTARWNIEYNIQSSRQLHICFKTPPDIHPTSDNTYQLGNDDQKKYTYVLPKIACSGIWEKIQISFTAYPINSFWIFTKNSNGQSVHSQCFRLEDNRATQPTTPQKGFLAIGQGQAKYTSSTRSGQPDRHMSVSSGQCVQIPQPQTQYYSSNVVSQSNYSKQQLIQNIGSGNETPAVTNSLNQTSYGCSGRRSTTSRSFWQPESIEQSFFEEILSPLYTACNEARFFFIEESGIKVEIFREMIYLNNLYRYALAGISVDIDHARKLLQSILNHTQYFANHICISKKLVPFFGEAVKNHNALVNSQIPITRNPNLSVFLFPAIFPQCYSQIGQLYRIQKKLDYIYNTLKKELESTTQISNYARISSEAKILGIQIQRDIQEEGHVWIHSILYAVGKVFEAVLSHKMLSGNTCKLWDLVQELWDILEKNFPNLREYNNKYEGKYPSIVDSAQEISYHVCEQQEHDDNKFPYVRISTKIFQPYVDENPNAAGYREIIKIYQHTQEYALYQYIIEPYLYALFPSQKTEYASKISFVKKEEIVTSIIDDIRGLANSEMSIVYTRISGILGKLGIEILFPENCNNDLNKLEETSKFSDTTEPEVEHGYIIDGEITKCTCIRNIICPSFFNPLVDFLKKYLPPGMQKHIVQIEQPEFWISPNIVEVLYPLVKVIDRGFYCDISTKPQDRQQYEDDLYTIANQINDYGIPCNIVAGSYQLAKQKAGIDLPTEFVPKSQGQNISLGYPIPKPNFQRPMGEVSPVFFYCRGITPEIVFHLKDIVPIPHITAADNIINNIMAQWPYPGDTEYSYKVSSLSKTLVIQIMSDLILPLYANTTSPDALISIKKIYNMLQEDQLPQFHPNPNVIGNLITFVDRATCAYQASQYTYHCIFSDEYDKGRVIKAAGFSLDAKEFGALAEHPNLPSYCIKPEYQLIVSAGKAPPGLVEFHNVVISLLKWVEEYKAMTTTWGAKYPEWIQSDVSAIEFQEYAKNLCSEVHTISKYYPRILGWNDDLLHIHQNIFKNVDGSAPQDWVHGLFNLVQLVDFILASWGPMEALRQTVIELSGALDGLLQYLQTVHNIRLENDTISPDTMIPIYQMPFPRLGIKRRRIYPGNYKLCYAFGNDINKFVIVQGKALPTPSEQNPLEWQDTEQITLLREFFLYILALLQTADCSRRAECTQKWEEAYYELHKFCRENFVRNVMNVFYESSDVLEITLKNDYRAFQKLEKSIHFLVRWLQEKHQLEKHSVKRGDRYSTNPMILKSYVASPYAASNVRYAQDTVVFVKKPAFIRDNVVIQQGQLEIQK